MTISDSTSTAVVGLLGGHGLNLSGVPTLLSSLAAAPIISEAIVAVTNSGDNTLGSTTLPGLISTVPSFITNIGTGLGIPLYTTQYNKLTNTGSVIGFLSNLSQIYGFATLAANYSVEMMNSLVLNTMGLPSSRNTLAYTVTTGLSNLMVAPLQANIATIAADFSNTGTLYPIGTMSDLNNLGTPGSIYSALLAANIPGAVSAQTSLSAAGVDLTNLNAATSQTTIMNALLNINSSADINAIVTAFNLTIYKPILQNAGTLTILPSMFPNSYKLLNTSSNTFPGMGSILGSINLSSSYNTLSDLGTFLSGISFPPNYASTCIINTSVTPDTLYSYASTIGAGSSIGGTLSVTDFFNVIDPTKLTTLVNTMITNLTNLSTTTQGVALIALLVALQTATTLTIPSKATLESEIEAALLVLLNGNNLASQYAIAANTAWVQIMSILSISVFAVSKSGVSLPTSAITSTTVIMGLAQNLSSFGQDPNLLGTGSLLMNLTTNDVYGASIQAAINGG